MGCHEQSFPVWHDWIMSDNWRIFENLAGPEQHRVRCFPVVQSGFQVMDVENSRDQEKHFGERRRDQRMSPKHALQLIYQTKCTWGQSRDLRFFIPRVGLQSTLAFELAILGHVMFLRDLEGVNTGLMVFWEQIEKGHTFISTLLADTFRALEIARILRSSYLECCVSLLQIWFPELLIACRPLVRKGIFHEDLIRDHHKRTSSSSFKSKADWMAFLSNLHSE